MPGASLERAPTITAVETPWLSVIVPAFNEEETIGESVTSLRDWLRSDGRPYEIIVVDNASEDQTVAQLKPLLDGTRIRILRNERNRGKGYSMRLGMLSARGELRLHCDADCYPSLVSLPAMLDRIDAGADVVVGSRLAPGARIGRRQALPRRIVGRSFVLLCRLILREPTTDLYCGFKLWRAQAAQEAYSLVHLEGWTFDAEVLALARARGWRLEEIGIQWTDREGSRLVMHRVLIPVVRELLAARRRVRQVRSRPDLAQETVLAAAGDGPP